MKVKHLLLALQQVDPELHFVTHANNHTLSTYDVGRKYYDSTRIGILQNKASGTQYVIIGNFSQEYYNKGNEGEPVVKVLAEASNEAQTEQQSVVLVPSGSMIIAIVATSNGVEKFSQVVTTDKDLSAGDLFSSLYEFGTAIHKKYGKETQLISLSILAPGAKLIKVV
jgi:hypothetical protein